MAETKRYNLAQLMFEDLEIVADGFKTSLKKDAEDLTATNNDEPYDTQFGKKSYEWEASDIDPALRKDLVRIWENDETGTIATYDFDKKTGDLIEDDVFYNAYITEVSKENANKPFSVKGAARSKKKT